MRLRTKPFFDPYPILARACGGSSLDDDDPRRRKRKGKSASGEVDGPMRAPEATIFEEVAKGEDGLQDEGDPVAHGEPHGEPHVDWDDEEGWEALLEDLFTEFEDEEDAEVFEEVVETLGWSSGEVIWEGMDFDQMFIDSGEFHAFELLSRKDQRAFLRDRLRTQQASGVVEAGDGEIDLDVDRRGDGKRRPKQPVPTGKDRGPSSLVSYETETEHSPEELEIGISPDKGRRRKRP